MSLIAQCNWSKSVCQQIVIAHETKGAKKCTQPTNKCKATVRIKAQSGLYSSFVVVRFFFAAAIYLCCFYVSEYTWRSTTVLNVYCKVPFHSYAHHNIAHTQYINDWIFFILIEFSPFIRMLDTFLFFSHFDIFTLVLFISTSKFDKIWLKNIAQICFAPTNHSMHCVRSFEEKTKNRCFFLQWLFSRSFSMVCERNKFSLVKLVTAVIDDSDYTRKPRMDNNVLT